MKNFKGTFVLAILATMTSLLLSACAPASNVTSTPSNTTSSAVTPTVTVKPTGTTDSKSSEVFGGVFEENITDLGGYTFVYSTPWANEYQAKADSSDLVKARAAYVAQIEKDYNCKIKFVASPPSVVTELAAALAGGQKYADMIEVSTGNGLGAANANVVDKISNIKGIDLTKPWPAAESAMGTFLGRQYTLGNKFTMDDLVRTCLFFNKTLMKTYKMENIYDLVDKGEWTFAKFRSMCEQIYKETGGKTTGLVGSAANAGMTPELFVLANASSFVDETGTRLAYKGSSEGSLEALNFFNQLYKDKLVFYPRVAERKKQNWKILSEEAMVSFSQERGALFFVNELWLLKSTFSRTMEDDFGIVPLPKGPKAKDYVSVTNEIRYNIFPKNNPDIDKAAAVMTALAARDFELNKDWKEDWSEVLRDDESAKMLEMLSTKPVKSQLAVYGLYKLRDAVGDGICDGSATPQEVMDSNKVPTINALSSLFLK